MAETQPGPSSVSPDNASVSVGARGVILSALSAPGAAEWLRQLDAAGVLIALMPELEALKGVQQPKEHYWDVYGHCIETVAAVEYVVDCVRRDWQETNMGDYLAQGVDGECNRLTLLKLAGLLHDVAKPQTKVFEREPSGRGRMHFFGHSEVGAETARRILSRLDFSLRAQQMVEVMVEHHLRPAMLTTQPDPPTERAIYRFFRDTADVGVETFLLNLADHNAMRGPLLSDPEWQQHMDRTRDIIRRYLAKQKMKTPAKLVDGEELMARFGLRPGPLVGELLSAIREGQSRGDVTSREDAIALVKQLLTSKHNL